MIIIIREVAEEFDGEFGWLDENAGKYVTFPAPIQKENANGKSIIYKIV